MFQVQDSTDKLNGIVSSITKTIEKGERGTRGTDLGIGMLIIIARLSVFGVEKITQSQVPSW